MRRKVATKSSFETKKFAALFLKKVQRMPDKKRALVIGFSGELGVGKTTLIQGIGKEFGIKEKIQSPTFVFVRTYPVRNKKMPWRKLVHIDAYRIERQKETAALDLASIFKNSQNFVAVEWAERIKKFLPKETIWVEMRHRGGNHRHIVIKK